MSPSSNLARLFRLVTLLGWALVVASPSEAAGPARALRLISGPQVATQPFSVGVDLVSQGDENSLGFSLQFDPARLEFVGATAANGGFSLLVNTRRASQGFVGFALSRSAGLAFASGTNRLLQVQFRALATTGATTLAFADSPVIRETVGTQAQLLTTLSEGAALDVQPLVLPEITVQPVGTNLNAGFGVLLSVQASGSPPLRYQWKRNEAPLPNATNATLLINPIQENQAGDYRAIVSNPAGSVTSGVARVVVLPALTVPSIVRNPEPVVASAGETVSLRVQATGSEPLAYQWQRQNINLPDQTGSTLILTNLTVDQAGDYRVIVENRAGTATSTAVALSVSATPRAVRIGRLDAAAGSRVELPVELFALGDENSVGFSLRFDPAQLEYRGWRRGTSALGTAVNVNAAGLAEGRLGLAVSKPAGLVFGSGTSPLVYLQFLVGQTPVRSEITATSTPIRQEIADARGAIRASEFVGGWVNILDTPPSISRAPVDTVARLYSSVTLEVAAGGSTPLSYAWRRDGETVPGATEPRLSFGSVLPAQAGNYQVVVTNAVGAITSAPVRLEVRRVVRLGGTNVPTGTSVELPLEWILAGSENALGFSLQYDPALVAFQSAKLSPTFTGATLNVRTNGSFPGRVGVAIARPPGASFPAGTQTVASLVFQASQTAGNATLTFTDSPIFRELADTNARPVSTEFVNGGIGTTRVAPEITRHPVPREITQGESAVFAVAAVGSLPMSYQWRRNDVDLPSATNATFSLVSGEPVNAGNYSVRITNPVGNAVSSNALLTVNLRDLAGPTLTDPTFDGRPVTSDAVLARAGILRLSATDPSGVSRVEFYVDDTQIAADANPSDGFSAPLDPERFSDGPRTLLFRAFDSRSNPSELSVPVRFALAAPVPPVIGLPQSGTVTSNRFVTVRGTGPARANVVLYRNDVRTGTPVPVDHLGIFETSLPLVEGPNRLQAATLNRTGESAKSAEVTVVVDTSLPAAPGGLRTTARSSGRVLLEWVLSAESFRGYQVYRAASSFTERSAAQRVTGAPIASGSLEDTPPDEGRWFYRIALVNLAGVEGLLSAEAVVETDRTAPTARVEYRLSPEAAPTSGPVGRGVVGILLNLNEAVDGTPFLSLTPSQGQPLVVDLTRVTETQYRGSVVIGDTTPSGTSLAVFAARDRAGNRGSRITSGARLEIDAVAPEVTELTVQPADPIRNLSTEPVLVTVGLTLSEPLRVATVPDLRFSLSASAPTPQPVATLTAGADPLHWTATFRLPEAAGQNPETLALHFIGEDALGNRGSRVVPKHEFQVYLGELPALVAPVALTARTVAGGQIALEWQRVSEAVDYALRRRPVGANEFALVTFTGDTNRWVDLPATDGIYEYAVLSVRRRNGQEALSVPSNVATAESDRRPPEAPSALVPQLAKNGVFLRWTAPANALGDLTYSLYRTAQTPPAEATGLTPLIQRIPITQVVDPSPVPGQPFYAVAAVDRAGNVSPLSNPAYLNIELFPVQSLALGQTNNDPPILTWTQVGTGVAGHEIFLGDANSNLLLNRRGLITDNRFIDVGFTGGERPFTIFTVDTNGRRSPGRTLLLPALSVTLAADAVVKRGLMNRLSFTVKNDSRDPILDARLKVTMAGRVHISETFRMDGQTTAEIPVVVGGYAELPEGTAPYVVTLESHPEEGATVRWARSGSVNIGEGQLVIGVLAADLLRGGVASVRFSLLNPSTEPLEVITAAGQGNSPSPDIRVSLFDAEGRQLASAPFLASTGTNLVLLPDGNIVMRLNPGQEIVSPELDLPIPASVPNHVWVQVEIDRVFYHADQEDRVVMRGVKSAVPFTVTSTSYTGEITSVSPEHSRGGEPITISGRGWFRAKRQPAPRQPLLVKIANGGFERTEQVVTDDNGLFSTQFTPLETESGGVYSVWAVHPDLTDRAVQKQFVIERLLASPQQFTVRAPHYLKQAVPLKVTAGAGTDVSNLRFVFLPEDQPSRAFPRGVSVDTGAPVSRLSPNQSVSMSFLVTGTPEANAKVDLVVRLVSGDDVQNPWALIRAKCEFSEAYPSLKWSPSLVDTGTSPGSNVVEQVTFENVGLVSATNLFFSLHQGDGSAAPSWVALTSPARLNELAVGEKALVGLSFRPPTSLPEGDYWFVLKTRSGNHPTVDLAVHVAVLTGGRGDLAFKVVDMYTGQPGNDGVRGARIRLRHQTVSGIETNLVADVNGEAVFTNLPAGLYDYQVTAENHNSSNGRAWVRSGSTASQHVALAYSLVSVEWEVVPITIEDRYEIVLQAVFETDVPAAVVTLEPAAVNLPQLFVGDVFYGEFVLENHGLIRADHLQIQLPASDAYVQYEILAGVPDHLEAKQKVRIPYRITCLTSFPGPRTPPATSNPALAMSRNANSSSSVAVLGGLPASLRQTALMGNDDSDCFKLATATVVTYDYICINGEWFRGAVTGRYWYNYWVYSCGDVGVIISTIDGSSGPGGTMVALPSQSMPGLPQCCPPDECEQQDQCDQKCCQSEGATCGSQPPPPPTPPPPQPDGDGDEENPPPGPALASSGPRPGARFKFSNPLRCEADGRTTLESDRRRLTFQTDSQVTNTIVLGTVPYQYLDSRRTLFAYRANRIRMIPGGFRWENLDGKWEIYDAGGRLLRTGHRNLLQTRRFYDDAGRLSEVRDALGSVLITYSYNAGGQVIAAVDRSGRRSQYDYTSGRLTRAVDVEGREYRYTYAADPGCGQRSMVSTVSLPGGYVKNFQYRSAGCEGPVFLYSLLDGAGNGHYLEHRYEPSSRTYYLKITSTGGEVLEKSFDRTGHLIEERVNGRIRQKIVRSGRTEIVTDAAGNETRRDYDEFGKVLREVAADGGVSTWEYDPVYHEPTRIENPRGAVTLMNYDARGNLTQRIDAAGTSIARTNAWVFNRLNQKIRHTDGRGNSTDYEYDGHGNLVREFDPANPAYETRYGYDGRGNRTSVTNALGHVTAFGFDTRDRLVAETNALGHVTRYTYDHDRLVEVETGRDGDQRGRIVRYRYDDQGRRTQMLRVDDQGHEHVWETTRYDGEGRVIATENALGQVTTYDYDTEGRRTRTSLPFSATETSDTRYEYDDAGRLVREIDPMGVATRYDYDVLGRQWITTEAVGTDVQRSRQREFDLSGNLVSIAYSDGTNTLTTFYDYDLLNRRIGIRGAREYPKQFEYDANDNLVAEINGRGFRTEHRYDAYNRRTNTVEGIGQASPGEHAGSYVYDAVSRITTAYDGNRNHRHYHHDALGRLVAESIPLAPTNAVPGEGWWLDNNLVRTRTTYNAWGQTVGTSNIVGAVTATVYDGLGRRFTHTDAAGLTLTNEYNALDQVLAIGYPVVSSAPEGSPPTSIRYGYDERNARLLVSTTDRANLTTRYSYDKGFHRISELSSWGARTTYRIDAMGRQVAVTNALGEVTGSVLDQFDQLVATVHPDHEPPAKIRIEYRAYDVYGRMTNHWGAATYDVLYEYDLAGNQVKQIDGNGNPTRWEYDGRNRKVRKIYADNSDYEYGYDANGNQIRKRDAMQRRTSYEFNAYSLLVRADYPRDHDVMFGYDLDGRRVLMLDGSGTNTWSYDAADRILTNNQYSVQHAINYTYDSEGNKESMLVMSLVGRGHWRTDFKYDASGRLVVIADDAISDGLFRFLWDSNASMVTEVAYPSGLRSRRAFDPLRRISGLTVWDIDGSEVVRDAYYYDASGQRTERRGLAGKDTFGYDDKRQLESASRENQNSEQDSSWRFQYDYDLVGNFKSSTDRDGAGAFVVNELNQYSEINKLGTRLLKYDLNGNLTHDGFSEYAFDDCDRLIGVVRGEWVGKFYYDGLGRLALAQTGSSSDLKSMRRVYSDALNVLEFSVESNEYLQITRGLDLSGGWQLFGGIGGLLALTAPDSSLDLVSGAGGDVEIERAYSIGTISKRSYSPFGDNVADFSSIHRFGFSSKEFFKDLGVTFFGRRFYLPGLGRWLGRDPIEEEGGLNLYGFVGNNPVNRIDPWGLDDPGCTIGDFGNVALFFLWPDLYDCFLRCCSVHDACYFKGTPTCTSGSWSSCMITCPSSHCQKCNWSVTGCFVKCKLRFPPPNSDRWFCPRGPYAGTFFENYRDVPASCWEGSNKP